MEISAVAATKSANMPNDNIDRAIKRAVGDGEGENFQKSGTRAMDREASQ